MTKGFHSCVASWNELYISTPTSRETLGAEKVEIQGANATSQHGTDGTSHIPPCSIQTAWFPEHHTELGSNMTPKGGKGFRCQAEAIVRRGRLLDDALCPGCLVCFESTESSWISGASHTLDVRCPLVN